MKRVLISMGILLIASFCNIVIAQARANKYEQSMSIMEVKDPDTIHLLANLEILGELTTRSSPYFVRVIKVRDQGECDGVPETCPKEALYVVVSTYDEYPEQKAYLLPKTYDWKFVKWVSLPKEEGPQSFVKLRLIRKDISKDRQKYQWVETEVDVSVNPWQAK